MLASAYHDAYAEYVKPRVNPDAHHDAGQELYYIERVLATAIHAYDNPNPTRKKELPAVLNLDGRFYVANSRTVIGSFAAASLIVL